MYGLRSNKTYACSCHSYHWLHHTRHVTPPSGETSSQYFESWLCMAKWTHTCNGEYKSMIQQDHIQNISSVCSGGSMGKIQLWKRNLKPHITNQWHDCGSWPLVQSFLLYIQCQVHFNAFYLFYLQHTLLTAKAKCFHSCFVNPTFHPDLVRVKASFKTATFEFKISCTAFFFARLFILFKPWYFCTVSDKAWLH